MKTMTMNRLLLGAILVLSSLATGVTTSFVAAQAAEIEYIVNRVPITSYDISRRAAFLRLQRSGGNVNQKAADEMVEQVLKQQEMARLGINVTDEQVDTSYANFAKSNNLSIKQLDGIMAQSGVTRDHFRDYIRTQMGWNQALGARARADQGKDQRQIAERVRELGGEKPSATEYLLQQFIFVVPERERGQIMGRRKREAEAMRAKFSNCDGAHDLAKQVIDVTVRNLGRFIEPELPPDWKKLVVDTSAGGTTGIRETERGVEFLAVCSTRQVSDDRVAQMMLQEEAGEADAEELDNEYVSELRERAQIVER